MTYDTISPAETTLIDFSELVANSWQIVSYNVMGGISRGSFRMHGDRYTVFSGTPVRGTPKMNADAVAEIGFMIQDKQEGSFRLGVSKLSGYR